MNSLEMCTFIALYLLLEAEVKYKSMPIKGGESQWRCDMWTVANFLENWLVGGGEVFSLTCWPRFKPAKISGIQFSYRLSVPQDHREAGRISSMWKNPVI
jgi:hypothetical protein